MDNTNPTPKVQRGPKFMTKNKVESAINRADVPRHEVPGRSQGLELEERTVAIPKDPLEFKKSFGFNPQETNVLICTPAYGGMVNVTYMHSLFQTCNLLSYCGIKYGIKTITNESLITRGRMTSVSYFLSHPEYTHIWFIDSDVSFPNDTVLKLLKANKDVISSIYPKKGIEWGKLPDLVKASVKDGKLDIKSLNNISKKMLSYVVNFESDKMKLENGCIKVKDAPTGCMMIKRATIDKLVETFPDMWYNSDLNLDPNDHKPNTFWLFFDCMVDPVDRRYLSEDYAFCRLVQQAGMEVWADITSPLTHAGTYNFEGNVIEIFDIEK